MKSATPDALRIPVQIVFQCGYTSESYVIEEGWQKASIRQCPKCDRRVPRHGTYQRKNPEGIKIARFYCRPCHITISLLPDFLAAGYGETLAKLQEAVEAVEKHSTFDEAAWAVRAEIQLQGARRWLRRRIQRIDLIEHLATTQIGIVGEKLDPWALRKTHPKTLRHLPTPVGLAHRHIGSWRRPPLKQQPMGPDPPV